ncbi:MAG: hypothetical protein ACI9FR_002919 [Cryomorphaceae bacterium]
MKITFVAPSLNLTGGLRVISVYADLLAKRGHEVTVISPGRHTPSLVQRIKSILSWRGYKFRSGFDVSYFVDVRYCLKVLPESRAIISEDLPDADVIIATFWKTAEWVATLPERKGRKTYFVQHIETHPWMPIDRVESTYRLNFPTIAVAKWIAETLAEYRKHKRPIPLIQ